MEERNQQKLDKERMGEITATDDVDMITQDHEEHHHHHHHHSGHSHHRHHHHKHKSSKKKNKFTAFVKKHKSALINVLSCAVSVALLIVLAVGIDDNQPKNTEVNHTDITQSTVRFETSVYHEKVLLVNEAIAYYMQQDNEASANEVYKLYNGHKKSLNLGLPLNFTYRVTGLPRGVEAQSAVLEISEDADYREQWTYQLNFEESSISVYNLKTGTKYHYRVTLTLTNDNVITTTGSFETERSPRILNIDGAVNARDIGGWSTKDGRTIKQGLLYRGSEIDGAVQPEYKITDFGLQQMIARLGIRFDMDLRGSLENENGTDALGKNVVHKYYGVGMYSELLKDKERLREVFSDLADPDNYPMYMHCTYGRDRTGSVCYLLEALLGMSDEDLLKEYELSAFTDSYVNTAEFNAFVEEVSSFDGETTQQKVEGYLLSIGVTAEEIATIRDTLLEGEAEAKH